MSSEIHCTVFHREPATQVDSLSPFRINDRSFSLQNTCLNNLLDKEGLSLKKETDSGKDPQIDRTPPLDLEQKRTLPFKSDHHQDIANQPSWSEVQESKLMGPYEYLAKQPGKDFRNQFIAAFNTLLQVPPQSLGVITSAIKMLHTASLLIDDIEDFSVLRRGLPVANTVFGVAQTINSANYVYFKALSELTSLGNPELIEIFTSELLSLHRGQGLDLYWRDNLNCPSEAEYLDMVDQKTGGLFRLAVRLMQAESTTSIDCSALVTTFGQLFQVLDDYLNLSPTAGYSSLKGYCEDLTEGKFSFPMIHAIHADPTNQVLLAILRLRTTNEKVKKYALDYMESKGSFRYCEEVVSDLVSKIEELLKRIDAEMTHSDTGEVGTKAVKDLLQKLIIK